MQKLWAVILLSALASNYQALPQTKWSRPIRSFQGQLTRERRQFPFGDWIPLAQSCPTCRLFADPLDAGLRGENIGLTPPRPPTVTRQIHGEGNFFPQDESSILSVPPPPPSISTGNGNFQFSSFGQQFNNPLPVPPQKIVPQNQQIQFFSQSFLPNQPVLNPQILPSQNNFFAQGQQQVNSGKATNFQSSDFNSHKIPENVVLEQNKRPLAPKPFSNKPQPFTSAQQNQQQAFVQQQTFGGQRQQFGNTILTPPPAPTNVSQDIVIPGLDKEEIQLLYVPVETLRQRGNPQEQLLTQQPQNIQFYNRQNGAQRPVNNIRPTEQTLVTQTPKGHFVTQTGSNGQSDSTLKVTSGQPFSTPVTPSTLLLQHLPFQQQTPQPFVSATPPTPTIQPFVTTSSAFQKLSPFTPETTLSHLSTVSPNTIQFSSDFGTTPKAILNQGVFDGEIVTGKTELSGLKGSGFASQQQSFVGQQQVVTQPPQQSTVFTQEQQKVVLAQNPFPTQIDQTQIALQKQQENQRLLQQQKELEKQKFLEQQINQKELEEQRLLQQRRQKELEQQRFAQKQKELEEQRLIQQQRQKELEQQRFAQKQKELEEQRLLQQQRQKELEQQRYLQKQKELEEQRRLQQQQRQKELEQQRFLQKQKELEEQRLQQQRQKELEQQRFLQQQRQKELEEQRFLQEQRQKELEHQRRLQLQKQKELEEKRLLQQLKQKEEEQQRLLRFQQQQKELENQKLLQAQQEQQRRLLQQQKQETIKNQQQFQLFQQQQKQNVPQQANRHVLPENDNLNLIPQLEKESEEQLVPHQPPLSVFFKSPNNGEARITDVLRELRSSNTITVLDQYFEKMPKVFVGPAGLIPPTGYGKFDLPYLSNLESNRIDRRIDRLPFFVAPLNFVPPPGYAKIPFPAPHVGSVVISSESNPAMQVKLVETGIKQGSIEEENPGSFPVVGPELPGLINNLDTVTTTAKPVTYASTPSLPQTTAQLRSRRPNNSLYKPQSRKPITRTRSSTTSRPEEEVTQPIQKTEVTKDSEGVRKPFNRFLHRRRQQTKSTTESPLKGQQDGKNLENRHYSVEVYHQEKNQVPRTQVKSDVIQESGSDEQLNRQFEHDNIDRITPGGHGVFEVRPTLDYSKIHQTSQSGERNSDYDLNLQTFEDGPLPTGSAKTITQELYRPNAISQPDGDVNYKTLSKPDSTGDKFQTSYEEAIATKSADSPDVSPTAAAKFEEVSEEHVSVQPTLVAATEKQDVPSENYYSEAPTSEISYTQRPVTPSGELHTKGFLDSNEQYTSAFAEISKHHHIPGVADSGKRQPTNAYPTQQIPIDLQAPLSEEFGTSGEVRPTENAAGYSDSKILPTGESYSGFETVSQQQESDIPSSQVSPTAPGATATAGFSVSSEANFAQPNRHSEEERIGSFISLQNVHSTENTRQYYPSSTPEAITESNPIVVEQNRFSSTPASVAKISVHPSAQTYTTGSGESVQYSEQVTEGHGQDSADNLGNNHRLKLPNPSIVRVRTRVRGKSRGQVNFAASQSTTSAPFTRSGYDSRHKENSDQDSTTKTTNLREYNPVKTSKYNQYRGLKKPVRTTTEATTEYEQKTNVYTIRPPRRPLNPSTVSTKRIRRPTTPLPSAEAATEAFGVSTGGSYYDHSDISPSGVSNDVYYEQSSLSPVKNKFRKHFGSAEQKNDVAPGFISTAFPPLVQTYSTAAQDGYSEESHVDLGHTAAPEEHSDKYPEWNPSESGFDVSSIVLTTIRTPGQEEEEEVEEPKKAQDSKKAFDPDLEKKTGRRRVRVRVHKRPHENFETAESQNLRTVANVLVPPTSTYKPIDESGSHQLAKNADFSFGGQKFFGVRSREYFRKRLNLTEGESVSKGEQTGEGSAESEGATGGKLLGVVRKSQKNEFESSSSTSNESSEGSKITRPKFRGFVRKIIKHGGVEKEKESESNQLAGAEENESKQGNGEFHPRPHFRLNQGGFNHTGRINGTKHKTLVRFVKKNKIRPHEIESHVESDLQVQKESEGVSSTAESHAEVTEAQQTSTTEAHTPETQQVQEEQTVESHDDTEENNQSHQAETTVEPEVKQTQPPPTPTTEVSESSESAESSSQYQEVTSTSPSTPHQVGFSTQRPKFFQTIRPVYQRTSQGAFYRTRETEAPSSTTERSEQQERRTGFSRFKYGKPTGFGSTTTTEKTEESKKVSEQQLKNKNLHTLEVRKYLRTKNREGGFSQFSRNRYYTSEKTETETTKHEESQESEEVTSERTSEESQTETTDIKTTQPLARTDSLETEGATTKTETEQPTTTEAISLSGEESSQEEDETTSAILETTTETEVPTTAFRASSTETTEKASSTETPATETQPDIYRFSKDSFSFDETENFTGTKNRAHVRNITTDIIENTASFSAPGVEKRPDIHIVTQRVDEVVPTATDSSKEKTEVTTEGAQETTTEYPETESTAAADAITKAKVAKILKTSTTTKISHETEICYKGKCIRTKSENPDEDLKLLVDSASTMKIQKRKT